MNLLVRTDPTRPSVEAYLRAWIFFGVFAVAFCVHAVAPWLPPLISGFIGDIRLTIDAWRGRR